jgi:hypothetical protein
MTQQIAPTGQTEPQDELSILIRALAADQRRLAQNPPGTPQAISMEVSGTVLAYLLDTLKYLQKFEQAVIVNVQGLGAAIEDIADNGGGGTQDTQFTEEDAARFLDTLGAAKMLAEATRDNPANAEAVKQQMIAQVAGIDGCIEMVKECTLEDDDEEDEPEEPAPGQPPRGLAVVPARA